MKIQGITIIGGYGKDGSAERVERVDLRMGDIVSIVGPTGCGKTTLINDIELFANGNTPSGRRVLFNGKARPASLMADPAKNPVSLISQHTNFLSDLPVADFLETHARIRRSGSVGRIIGDTLDFANQLTGEPLIPDSAMTELSGGQTRALLIADAVVIGNSPIILLDEIENAGIHRTRALELLKKYEKIFVFVTHDPRISLLSDRRIVMKNGSMQSVLATDEEERKIVGEIMKLDDLLLDFRNSIRNGERLTQRQMENRLRMLGYLS